MTDSVELTEQKMLGRHVLFLDRDDHRLARAALGAAHELGDAFDHWAKKKGAERPPPALVVDYLRARSMFDRARNLAAELAVLNGLPIKPPNAPEMKREPCPACGTKVRFRLDGYPYSHKYKNDARREVCYGYKKPEGV